MFETSFSVPVSKLTLDHVPTLKKAHACIVPIKAELDQMVEGMKLFSIIDVVRKVPHPFKELFVPTTSNSSLSAAMMLELFNVELSIVGSNNRENEESAVCHWNEFLMDVQNGMAGMYI